MKTPSLHPLATSTQRGLTLVELMIALSIAAVLMVGSYYGYSMMYTAKAQNTVRLLTHAGTCARTSFATGANFTGVSATELADAGCFPEGNVTRGDAGVATVTNSDGRAVTVAAANGPGDSPDAMLSFTVAGPMDRSVCTQIANGLLPSASALTVGAQEVKTSAGAIERARIPAGCAAANNAIVYSVVK